MRGCRSHLRCVPVVLGGRPGTSACSSAGEPTTSRPGRPRMCCAHSLALMTVTVTVRICSSAAELERSLEIYNEVWPRRAATSEDVARLESVGDRDRRVPRRGRRRRRGIRRGEHRHLAAGPLLDARDRAAARCGAAASARRSSTLRPVGGRARRARDSRQLSSPTTRRASASRCAGASTSTRVRRAWSWTSRRRTPPAVDPPEGIEIVLLADRPELAKGAYDVGSEALPDIPGQRGLDAAAASSSSSQRTSAVSPSSSRSPTTRSSATRSCARIRTAARRTTA